MLGGEQLRGNGDLRWRQQHPFRLHYCGAGALHAIVQEEGMSELYLDLDQAAMLISFNAPSPPVFGLDGSATGGARGRGLLVQAGPKEFFIAGVGFCTRIAASIAGRTGETAFAGALPGPAGYRTAHYLAVDEGRSTREAGSLTWQVSARLNGDKRHFGLCPRRPDLIVHAVLE
jgi:hypothetical protein